MSSLQLYIKRSTIKILQFTAHHFNQALSSIDGTVQAMKYFSYWRTNQYCFLLTFIFHAFYHSVPILTYNSVILRRVKHSLIYSTRGDNWLNHSLSIIVFSLSRVSYDRYPVHRAVHRVYVTKCYLCIYYVEYWNFYNKIRNFIIDLEALPLHKNWIPPWIFISI